MIITFIQQYSLKRHSPFCPAGSLWNTVIVMLSDRYTLRISLLKVFCRQQEAYLPLHKKKSKNWTSWPFNKENSEVLPEECSTFEEKKSLFWLHANSEQSVFKDKLLEFRAVLSSCVSRLTEGYLNWLFSYVDWSWSSRQSLGGLDWLTDLYMWRLYSCRHATCLFRHTVYLPTHTTYPPGHADHLFSYVDYLYNHIGCLNCLPHCVHYVQSSW